MPDDLRALLAAIVADPADDTARLVYADCLQEHGNTARAQFIRLQIEAERLHPDSNARARLEERARALFAEHWIEWWGEVCAAVGFPMPPSKPRSALGRLMRRFGDPAGHPYTYWATSISLQPKDPRLTGWDRATFQRGFPGVVLTSDERVDPNLSFLQRWSMVSPLEELHSSAPYSAMWADGPHLSTLQSLTLQGYHSSVLQAVLTSPYLGRLEELRLLVWHEDIDYTRTYEDSLAHALELSRARQLRRLSIPLWTDHAAEVAANAQNLAGLEALAVAVLPPRDYEDAFDSEEIRAGGRRLSTLSRSPHLAGLRELTVHSLLDGSGIEAAICDPVWTGLRKLDLTGELVSGADDALSEPDDLPELEELRLSGVSYTVAQVAAFARSPLLKRLRHFAVRGGPPRSVDFDIAHAVGPERIETFAIGENELQTGVAAKLQDHFGDRFRVLS
jgi:uncharacterized protein (TIGR02996 family)